MSNYPHPLIAREGWPFLALALAVAIVLTALGWWVAAVIVWLLFAFILQFFRDPGRVVPPGERVVLSPADGRVVKVERARDPYLGRDALLRVKAEGPKRRLVSFSVDGFAPLHGGEPVIHAGEVVGSVSSAGFGHTLQKTIAFGYLPAALAGATDFEIDAFGTRHAAVRGTRCLYDPKGERLKS